MNPFTQQITQLLLDTLTQHVPEHGMTADSIESLITMPPNPEMGDYAFPCFSLAKVLRKAPPQISQELAALVSDALSNVPALQEVKAVGPYLNFHVSFEYMAKSTLPSIHSGAYFTQNASNARPKVMVEYSQPNTHKGFHVGHMRNVALGDSLCRIYKYNGHEVVAVNYIGDVGTHIAKCLWYYLNFNQEAVPEKNRGEWLGQLYSNATKKLDQASGDELVAYKQAIGEILHKLEAHEPEIQKVWDETKQWSMDDFYEIYHWLRAHFDHYFYESDVDEAGRQIVMEELDKGTFVRSEGAIGIDLEDANLGFFLLLKSDGNTLYSTKDLALAKRKFEDYQVDQSVYIVGAEQTLHFKQVFETLKRMGYSQAQNCVHLPYGLVMLPEGKMSSRAGNVILFTQLRDEMTRFIQETYLNQHQGSWDALEIEETTRKVAVAAIKYGMLNQDPSKPITFVMKDWLSSEGDTGTYLIYAYARIRSILRQIDQDPSADVNFALLSHEHEKALIRRLFDFNEVVWKAEEQVRPSLITRALYDLAKDFSRTYQHCSVRFAETEELKAARLLLFACVASTLKQGMQLLGIDPPERM